MYCIYAMSEYMFYVCIYTNNNKYTVIYYDLTIRNQFASKI